MGAMKMNKIRTKVIAVRIISKILINIKVPKFKGTKVMSKNNKIKELCKLSKKIYHLLKIPTKIITHLKEVLIDKKVRKMTEIGNKKIKTVVNMLLILLLKSLTQRKRKIK